jgi:hypothetical protein
MNFRPTSPLHWWVFTDILHFKKLFKGNWRVSPAPTKRVIKHTKDGECEFISFVVISQKSPLKVTFSTNTGVLSFEYRWKIINVDKMTTLDFDFE